MVALLLLHGPHVEEQNPFQLLIFSCHLILETLTLREPVLASQQSPFLPIKAAGTGYLGDHHGQARDFSYSPNISREEMTYQII